MLCTLYKLALQRYLLYLVCWPKYVMRDHFFLNGINKVLPHVRNLIAVYLMSWRVCGFILLFNN